MPVRLPCILLPVLLAAGIAEGGRRSALLTADSLVSVYPVQLVLALPGTDSVELDSRPLGPDEYELDFGQGLLSFTHPPPHGALVRVSWDALPLSVPAVWRRYRAEPAGTDTVPDPEPDPARVDTVALLDSDLEIGGSKTIGITIGGPEGSGLNQATRLAVSGTVEGIRVDAELSDQSSPIPPEGTTLEIEELDLIRVDVSGRDWQGRFGDVEFRLPYGGFGTLERRVVGGLVSGGTGPVSGVVGYARPRGRFGRIALSGIDGVQGPYLLAPEAPGATVVPGSEAVYLDGRRMTRGWDADYTIDYAAGELMFSSRHVIDRHSRIEATYQYEVEAWDRSDIIGGAVFAPGGFRFSADYFRESDDEHSGRYELSPDERSYLAGIGADTSRAWLEGGTRVGDGEGTYVMENGHYRYVGEGQGDYRVLFTFVGDSKGDYVFDDTLIAHRHVGPGAGDYVARYRVELPGRTELGRFEVEWGGAGSEPGGLRAGVTGVGQRRLFNLLAPDGAPELAGAGAGWVGWSGERAEARYQGRVVLPGFAYPGGDSLVGLEHRWGGLAPERIRRVNELLGRYAVRDWLEVGAELGLLNTDQDSLLARYIGRTRAGPVSLEGGRAGIENRAAVQVRPAFGWFRPRAGWELARAPRRGRTNWELGLGFGPGPGLELDAGYRAVRADTTEMNAEGGEADRVRQARETGGVAEARATWNPGDWLRTQARVAYQHRHYPAGAAADWRSWLTGAGFTLTPGPGLRLQADLQQSRRLVQLRDEYYRYVGPGQGGYSRDSLTNRYYPDPDGAWERVLASRGTFVPADELVLNLSGDWSAWRPLGLTGTLSRSGTTGEGTGPGMSLRRLHSHNLRATVRALEPVLTAWFVWSGSSTEDRTLVVTGQQTRRERYRAEFESAQLPGYDLRLRAEHGRDDRLTAAGQTDYAERLWNLTAEPVIGPRLRLELELGAEHSTITAPLLSPEPGPFTLLALNAGLGRNWSFGARWRLRARGGVVRRAASVEELPFEVGYTRPLGWTPSAGLDLSHILSEILTLTGRYDFLNRPDRDADHRVSAELRAYF